MTWPGWKPNFGLSNGSGQETLRCVGRVVKQKGI